MIPPEAEEWFASYGVPAPPRPPPKDGLTVLIEGAASFYRLPPFCEPCQVWGAEFETNCWNCGEHCHIRRTAWSGGQQGGAPIPLDQHAGGLQAYLRNNPDTEPLEAYLLNDPITHYPQPLTVSVDLGVEPDDYLHYWGGSPYGEGAF